MTQQPHEPATATSPPAPPRWPGLSVAAAILLVAAACCAGWAIIRTIPDDVGFARLAAFVQGLLPAVALWLVSLGLWLGGRTVAVQRGHRPPRPVPVLLWVVFAVIVVAWVLFEVVPRNPP